MSRSDDHNTPALLIVCSALFFGVVNGSAVAVVLPEIGAELGIPDSGLSWVLSGFLLAYGVAIPFYGRMANRFGARRLFLLGVGVFSIGSALSGLASSLEGLLAARTIQAVGGAAVPGLGMTLASRAFPEERRGVVLGIVSATMGVAAATGPLLAGVVAELSSWRSLFAISALTLVNVPLGVRFLTDTDDRTNEPLGLLGGALLTCGVAGCLLFVTLGSQQTWDAPQAVVSGLVALVAVAAFAIHQRRGSTPFIPTALLGNTPFVLLALTGFAVTFAHLAAQLGYPFLFSSLHDMSTLAIGVALVPAALATAVVGVVAGRIMDHAGARMPIHIGLVLMLLGAMALSTQVGATPWTIALLATVFGSGYALVNTPLAAVASLLVAPKDLATALSLTTMMFFVGGSFGASLFTSIAIKTQANSTALNPLHAGAGVGFSNAFLALSVPLTLAFYLSQFILRPRRDGATDEQPLSTPPVVPMVKDHLASHERR